MVDLLKPTSVDVRTENTLVVLKIGNVELKMDYNAALQISTWMRVKGKEAKQNAGDTSRHWSVAGQLSAIEAGERPG